MRDKQKNAGSGMQNQAPGHSYKLSKTRNNRALDPHGSGVGSTGRRRGNNTILHQNGAGGSGSNQHFGGSLMLGPNATGSLGGRDGRAVPHQSLHQHHGHTINDEQLRQLTKDQRNNISRNKHPSQSNTVQDYYPSEPIGNHTSQQLQTKKIKKVSCST